MLEGIGLLKFPPADVKDLKSCFPRLLGRYALEDGGVLLAFERPDNIFPLAMFGSLTADHAAWVVSRMENICCVLEYSGLIHGGISEHSLFINPFTHHAVLFGHWSSARKKGASKENPDLKAIRKTAERMLGTHSGEAPAAFIQFIRSSPAADAYSDFGLWDEVIEKGFGGRRFAKMNLEF